MKKVYVSWNDVQRQVQELVRQMWLDRWTPDYVVGITRGGLVPANLISQYLDCRMETLQVRLRDGVEDECESNFWMAEDAANSKNILIVDDINDSGATLNWIKKDWESSCMPNERYAWDSVWNHNVKFATLINNEASDFKDIAYTSLSINKAEEDSWIEFSWENWWK
jgi:xanthine phosphoribosyltransferase